MISMTLPQLRRSDDDRVVAGVCAGIAELLGVDPTLVRLIFAVLTLAGGAGIVLYLAAYLYMTGRGWVALLVLLVAVSIALGALGLSNRAVAGIALVAGGLALMWRRSGPSGPGGRIAFGGILIVGAGALLVLSTGGS